MIFSELYSVYYNTVAKIIERALKPGATERELQEYVTKHAFSESVMTILPSLKTGKWQLMDDELIPVLNHAPEMPISTLEKRWLKSIADDPRIRLFDVTFPGLDDVEPLFTSADYKIYDKYLDGDPYDDESYINNFRVMLYAIRNKKPVQVALINKRGSEVKVRFYPTGLEYSVKDDKFRVIATGCRFKQFNLGRITSCEIYKGNGPWKETPAAEQVKEVVLHITDERNALERAMLHFAHFEKQAERISDKEYILKLKYYEYDETEIVIRILSFGPYVKVIEPESFVNLIKERLFSQKSCGLK